MIRNVLEWMEDAVKCTPQRISYDSPKEKLSWAELDSRVKQIGSCIAGLVPAQSPVLILMDKSPACVAAMLGTVSAGCFYTPLDSSMPEARMQLVAGVLQPKLILCEEKYRKTAEGLITWDISEADRAGEEMPVVILTLDEIKETANEQLLLERRAQHMDNDLLYVLFTSGSTGIPKGVSITHRSVIDLVEWACDALKLPDQVRFGSQAPFYFDNSVLDIYCSMRMKGSLFLIPRSDFLFPKRMLETLERYAIDTIFWVPSALTSLANAEVLVPGVLTGLQRIFFCGEVMPCRTLNCLKKALPQADYVNMYGPTEITDVCAWYRVDREFEDTDALPIGKPCANTRIYLLDGELCVTGTCLSPGYYNAPEKTEKAFVQNPFRPQIPEKIYKTGDLAEYNEYGELMFLGRADSQIKKSGYRIELGEVECALQSCEGVELCCCWYEEAEESIVAGYTGEASEKQLRSTLKKLLPKYMLPDKILHRDGMPRTGSGKIDRLALRREVADEYSIT